MHFYQLVASMRGRAAGFCTCANGDKPSITVEKLSFLLVHFGQFRGGSYFRQDALQCFFVVVFLSFSRCVPPSRGSRGRPGTQVRDQLSQLCLEHIFVLPPQIPDQLRKVVGNGCIMQLNLVNAMEASRIKTQLFSCAEHAK